MSSSNAHPATTASTSDFYATSSSSLSSSSSSITSNPSFDLSTLLPPPTEEEEKSFVFSLDALNVNKWKAEQKKSLLFVVGCCLPTVCNTADEILLSFDRWMKEEKQRMGRRSAEQAAHVSQVRYLTLTSDVHCM